MPEPTIIRQHIPETPVPGKPLGRHIMVDSRSADYPVRKLSRAATPQPVTWSRHPRLWDQDPYGSCTGMALAGAVGTGPLWDALTPEQKRRVTKRLAMHFYAVGTSLDENAGTFHVRSGVEDTGSDGTSVCNGALRERWIGGFRHARNVGEMIAALQSGPVIIGVPWHRSFDEPDGSGRVKIGGDIRGGHQVEVPAWDGEAFAFPNSWGASYGVRGYGRMSTSTMDRLFEEGADCQQPLPLGVAA